MRGAARNTVRIFTSRMMTSAAPKRAYEGYSHRGFSAPSSMPVLAVAGLAATAAVYAHEEPAQGEVNYDAVKEDLRQIYDHPGYDDGSLGPILIRLAWHAAGSYSAYDHTGGSTGGTMRFSPEAKHGGNAGLGVARDFLEEIKKKHPGITYADLWSLAGTLAIEELGGPKVVHRWKPGRSDEPCERCVTPTPDGRLPDASQGADHIRAIFYRMGFNDQEIVALSGAHALGRCHRDRSGFDGPWTQSPTFFSNDYFVQLLETEWTPKKWDGPFQYEDPSGELMMLPTDIALTQDPVFLRWVKAYADDEELFFKDFASAWLKLQDLGVVRRNKSVWEKLFGKW